MYDKRLFGVTIPTITPMDLNGRVDEESTANFCRYLIRSGVDCLYPNGTNGESLMLTAEERRRIAEIWAQTNDHSLPLFIQCGSMTTAETAAHAQHAVEIGADGIGVMSPAFFPMDDEALYCYYRDVVSGLPKDFPVYVYNIPGCTTSDVKPALLKRLMTDFPNIVGIKFSSSDLMRVEDYLLLSTKPSLLIGCDSLFLQCLATGGVGTVTGPGSIFCERFARLYKQFHDGDLAGAAETQRLIVETDRQLTGMPGIPVLKALLKMRGVIKTDVCRAPLRPLTKEEYARVEKAFEDYMVSEGING